MSRLRTYLLVVTASAIAGMIGAAFSTGTAQAVVSTLVSVVNPSTSPVQTTTVNVTDPGRIAYQATLTNQCAGTPCAFLFPTVPAGHRVVVQHISGNVEASSETNFAVGALVIGGQLSSGFSVAIAAPDFTAFDQAVLFYVDATNSVEVTIFLEGAGASFPVNSFQTVNLVGYELDCSAVACAPIATQ